MSDIPQWIQDEADNRRRNSEAKLKEHGPRFLGNVIARIETNVKCLGNLGAQGRVSNLSKAGDMELRFRLDVRMNHGVPSLTYTDIFYIPGTLLIRCLPLGSGASDFRLCRLGSGEIGVMAEGEFVQMEAAAFGDWIVKNAVESLREVA